METLDTYLKAQIEPVTYAVFFGLLIVFGLLETRAERSHKSPARTGRWPANVGLTVLNIASWAHCLYQASYLPTGYETPVLAYSTGSRQIRSSP